MIHCKGKFKDAVKLSFWNTGFNDFKSLLKESFSNESLRDSFENAYFLASIGL